MIFENVKNGIRRIPHLFACRSAFSTAGRVREEARKYSWVTSLWLLIQVRLLSTVPNVLLSANWCVLLACTTVVKSTLWAFVCTALPSSLIAVPGLNWKRIQTVSSMPVSTEIGRFRQRFLFVPSVGRPITILWNFSIMTLGYRLPLKRIRQNHKKKLL